MMKEPSYKAFQCTWVPCVAIAGGVFVSVDCGWSVGDSHCVESQFARTADGSINRLDENRNAGGNNDVGRVDDVKRKGRRH